LNDYIRHFGKDSANEVNTIAFAHVLTMDLDETKTVSHCGVDVHEGNCASCLPRKGSARTSTMPWIGKIWSKP
jgi:hypothetical protein